MSFLDPAEYRLKVFHGQNLQMGFTYPDDLSSAEVILKIWDPNDSDAILLSKSSEDVSSSVTVGDAEGTATINIDVPVATVNNIDPTGDDCEEYAWCLQVVYTTGSEVLVYGPCQVYKSWVPDGA